MKMVDVSSSVLKAIGYDEKTMTLRTELLSRALYEYYEISTQEYDNFLKASSLGEHYNKFIKKHKYRKLK
ncbi:MAG TPA: KTSC domain-containing protein [Segetibacter sp.]|jgi:hypothetical protein